MPYTYTLAREARDRGLPLMRAMWLHYPTDAIARGDGRSVPLGPRSAHRARLHERRDDARRLSAGRRLVRLVDERARRPAAARVDRAVDLATMPIYARAGAIIPVDPIRQYTDEPVTEPTTLHVFPGANGAFTLYDDDGISQAYLAGRGNWIRMTWNDATRTLTLEPGAPAGATDVVSDRKFRVELLPEGSTKEVSYVGRRVQVIF